jgi:TonB family protein
MQIESLVDELDRPEEKSAAEKRREQEAKKEEEDKHPHGQVVDIARPTVEQHPDEANFVSEYDSKVDKETKGPRGREKAGGPGAASPTSPPPPAPAGGGEQAKSAEKRSGAPGPLALREPQRAPAKAHGADEQLPRDRDGDRPSGGARQPPSAVLPRPAGEAGEGGHASEKAGKSGSPGEQRPNLVASREMLERAIGKGAGSMDYLHDLDDGESTALNAKKWKHAPFFNRVKRAVADEWHPDLVYLRHDPSGNVYGVRDRVTVLRVHLGSDGKLVGSTVVQPSGIDFLDDEAIEAFKKAQPFPNPPKDLVEGDGKIHFNFAFIFELSGKTSFKVYKYQ